MALVASGLLLGPTPVLAGWPVIDLSAFGQHILAGLQRVDQLTERIRSTQIQLMEYENALQNSLAPAIFVLDDIVGTFQDLEQATLDLEDYILSLERYKHADEYKKFLDFDYYRYSPCYSAEGCTHEERALLFELHMFTQEQELEINKATQKSVKSHRKQILRASRQLEAIQGQIATATGQMQAVQAGNQLAALHAAQLLAMREQLAMMQMTWNAHFEAELMQALDEEANLRRMRTQRAKNTYNRRPEEQGTQRGFYQ